MVMMMVKFCDDSGDDDGDGVMMVAVMMVILNSVMKMVVVVMPLPIMIVLNEPLLRSGSRRCVECYACFINFIRTLLIKHTVIRIFSFLSCNQLIRALIVSSKLILIFGLSRLMLASQELQREKATPWIMSDQRRLKYQRLLEQPSLPRR